MNLVALRSILYYILCVLDWRGVGTHSVCKAHLAPPGRRCNDVDLDLNSEFERARRSIATEFRGHAHVISRKHPAFAAAVL